MNDFIRIKGAREHNLKNVSVDIPRNKFVVITGLSGSGKSTLAFDTLYAEGQRRYVESLSAYARQFLGLMKKPDVDSIDGLSPAISIEQKTTSKNPRSTVGTVTEIYDYLRLLFARIGVVNCPKCDSSIKPQSSENIVNLIMGDQGKKIMITAPIIRGQKGTHENVYDDLKKEGFTKVRVDSKVYDIETVKDEVKLERYEKHWIEAVIDTITISDDERLRISEGVEQALNIGEGRIIIIDVNEAEKSKKTSKKDSKKELKELERGAGETIYTTHGACPNHPEVVFEPLEPRMFSFNSPFGACSECHGLGEIQQISEDLIIPDKSKSIMDGALAVYGKMDISWRVQQISAVGKKFGFDVFTPIEKFSKKQLDVLLYGTQEPINARWSTGASMNFNNGWEGIIPQTMRLYKQTESEWRKQEMEKFMVSKPCKTCNGQRLKDIVLAVKIAKKSIIEVTNFSIEDAIDFFNNLGKSLNEKEMFIAKQVLKEINERLGFMKNVGLGYLSLSRSARTLSGGEAQRIRLATQVGSNLMGVMYILDEPSIGLHQRDNEKLINTLHKLRDIGNTLIVVEHDEDTIKRADYVIDMGPGAGIHGGHITAKGTVAEISKNSKSITGEYLSGKKKIVVPKTRRKPRDYIKVSGVTENNLKNFNIDLPLGVLCAITGVSGSGKSTLMNQTLMPYMRKYFGEQVDKIGKFKKIEIPEEVDNVIVIDQDPIGRTPRSNPATYTKIFDDVRKIFAATKDAKARGYTEGRFSFNVKGGRCESCFGDGVIKIEMNFLPDVYVECSECKGKRYNKETLQILYKGKNIADVLDMSVEEALSYFENHSTIKRRVETLMEVGLGYIKLGQSSTTLSGGESQRIKITRELAKQKRGNTVYMLDEPTTGLHFEDVRKLITVINKLVDKGNSVFVIEHNLDVVKCSDYVIDLGPEGGNNGGTIIGVGTPEEIVKISKSYTGQFLKSMLKG
ncbi:MAG TPA: excinuclease ABC subunit UvrA [Alphaproteobacteria bacterium]|nr:excinuclease ABC subunit UvrA [Alphaproteobacteria bacterium]